mgnify:CR=1 FL=1
MKHLLKIVLITCLLFSVFSLAVAAELKLADQRETTYTIVAPGKPTSVDNYALNALQHYLNQITGAEFAITGSADLDADQPAIFVGLSDCALKRLGDVNPMTALKAEEHVVRSKDDDIFLYGKGIHGNLWAVMNFLEASLGWRWYSVHEKPVTLRNPDIELEPLDRKSVV